MIDREEMEGKTGAVEDGQEQEVKKKGWALIVHDFKQKQLIPIKLLSFIVLASKYISIFNSFFSCLRVGRELNDHCSTDVISGLSTHRLLTQFLFAPLFLSFLFKGLGVLLPYMTIHMKSLGITVEETAIIYGVVPLFAILAPSTMGMIADKLGNFKVKPHSNFLF